MKVLFLAFRFPWPPDRGDRLTLVNMLRAFSAGHRVTLLSFVDGQEPVDSMANVQSFCERVVTVHLPRWRSWLQAWLGVFSTTPSQLSFYASGRMHAEVRRLVEEEKFDAVIAHAIRMGPFLPDAGVPVRILFQGDSVGIVLGRSIPFAPRWRRPGIAWERWRVDRYTAACARRSTETWVLSPIDLEDMRRLGGERLEYLPHGVDERLFEVTPTPGREPRVMFLGNLGVPHNVDAALFAARDIWPLVRKEYPDGELLLVGADPSPAVLRLAELPSVEVTGRVPDVLPLWRSAHVLLAPLRFSTGIQNKLLEAMAAGVPVVTTAQAAEAIGARHGEHLLVAEDAEALAAAVGQTLSDPAAAAVRAARARAHVRSHFSWDFAVRRLEQVVREAEHSAASGRR